jgi:hypothetical protein
MTRLSSKRVPSTIAEIATARGRALFEPHLPFQRKKGFRRETEIPLSIAMVPKGGLDRLSLRDHAIGLCGRARG